MRLVPLLAVLAVVGCNGGNTVSQTSGVAACASASACNLLGQGGIQSCSTVVQTVNSASIAAFIGANISAQQVNCLAVAGKDCDAAKRCLDNGQTPSSCGGSGPQSCMGTVLQSCNNSNGQGFTTAFDCATYGQMCVAGRNSTVSCGIGTCSTPSAMCMGNVLQTCDANGILNALDCSIFANAECNPNGVAHCHGKGAACQGGAFGTTTATGCNGSSVVYCLGGNEATFDCAQLGQSCFPNIKGAQAACALGNDCDPSTYSPTCMGTKLTFCNNGKTDTFDCASGGWSSCDPSNGGRCT